MNLQNFYIQRRILGLIETSGESKTGRSLMYLILVSNSSLYSFKTLFLDGCCEFRVGKEIQLALGQCWG